MKKNDFLFFVLPLALICFFSTSLFASPLYSVFLSQGHDAFRANHFQRAAHFYQRALDDVPEDPEASYWYGRALLETGDFHGALYYLRPKSFLSPEEAKDIYYYRARAFHKLGRLELAKENCIHALDRSSEDPKIHFEMGRILMDMKDYSLAAQAFRAAKDFSSETQALARIDLYRGINKAGKKDYEASDKLLRKIALNRAITPPIRKQAAAWQRRVHPFTYQPDPVFPSSWKTWKIRADATVVYDDNVILRPISTTLSTDISNQADYRHEMNAHIVNDFLKTPHSMLSFGYDFFQSIHYRLKSFNSHQSRPFLNYRFQWPLNRLGSRKTPRIISGEIGAAYKYFAFGQNSLYHGGQAHVSVQALFTPSTLANVNYQIEQRDFFRNTDGGALRERDSFNHQLDFTTTRILPEHLGVSSFYVGYGYEKDRTDGIDFRYQAQKVRGGITIPLPHFIKVNLGYQFQNKKYFHVDSLLLAKRKDQENLFTASFQYPLIEQKKMGFLSKNSRISFEYQADLNDSNISIYTYRRNVYTFRYARVF